MAKSILDAEKQFEKQAKENRRRFLAPYKKRFENAEKEKEKARIVIDMIKREPSHLEEPWILWKVVEWLRHPDSIDHLQAAFIDQTDRNRPTEKQKKQVYKDFFLIQAIDRIKTEKNTDKTSACEILAQRIADDPKKFRIYPQWNLDNPNDYLPKRLSDRYNKDRNKYLEHCEQRDKERQKMPFPYFGRDIRPF